MYIEVVGKDIKEFAGQKVILFGAGSRGLHVVDEFEDVGAKVIAFTDNNNQLVGQTIKDYPIIAVESLKNYHDVSIIISSVYVREIKQQLLEMGIDNFYSIIVGVSCVSLKPELFRNPLLDKNQANKMIYDGLTKDAPFCVSRLGTVEMETLCDYCRYVDTGKYKYQSNQKYMMNINAGFFPTEDILLDRFSQLYLDGMKMIDLMWSLQFSKYEDKMYSEYAPCMPISAYWDSFLPLEQEVPWTKALEGKKVLVIHPFEESILNNYRNRELLFESKDILPEFELKTLKAVQSIAGTKTQFDTWFDALQSMEEQIDNIDFDIALIGAGAYGLPLATYVKSIGKKAIHLGGATQVYFGIKGKFWNRFGIYNEYWTSPLESETPKDYKKVEAGRYW